MRRITSALVAAAATVLLTSAVAAAQGQTVDNRLTNVSFSTPVSVPGKTLPAGTYHFQLLDSQADRHIVQIFDNDNHLIATLMAVPAKRNQPQGDPVITFKETRADTPPAVHYWYYAGETSGSELVYPKAQAMEIARASGEPVMATDTESTEATALKSSKIERVSPDNANAQTPPTQPDTTTAPQQTSQPTAPPVTTAPTTPTTTAPTTTTTTTAPEPSRPQPTTPTTTTEEPTRPTTTPDTQASTPTSRPTTPTTGAAQSPRQSVGTSGRSLPHTASKLPEIGLVGLIALSAGLAIRFARKSLV